MAEALMVLMALWTVGCLLCCVHVLTAALGGGYSHHTHLKDEEAQAQRG